MGAANGCCQQVLPTCTASGCCQHQQALPTSAVSGCCQHPHALARGTGCGDSQQMLPAGTADRCCQHQQTLPVALPASAPRPGGRKAQNHLTQNNFIVAVASDTKKESHEEPSLSVRQGHRVQFQCFQKHPARNGNTKNTTPERN